MPVKHCRRINPRENRREEKSGRKGIEKEEVYGGGLKRKEEGQRFWEMKMKKDGEDNKAERSGGHLCGCGA